VSPAAAGQCAVLRGSPAAGGRSRKPLPGVSANGFSTGDRPRTAAHGGKHGSGEGGRAARRYNARFSEIPRSPSMEAERKNAIALKLADLAERGRELRRYL